ncbi:sensor histidine kinase [Pedobacter psychroterrae]|uniref:histidine kinase n=1 Tax=Pedobacter psychroterrae TaxID=2530453 RepID=A0A4R0NUS0_9SPHI|nr:PAS domain-containing sensor histidine kinase [Pedobacter psychroterrae]TCD03763.1 PAS domain-containing sensor histidine kinase [Pedobacter psychroterrae]
MPLSDTEYISILKTQYFEYEQLNKFFNLSGDLLCIAGFDGYFKRINPTVSQVLGYTQEELMAQPINEFVFKEDKVDTQQSRVHVYQGKPLLGFENRYVTKSGEIVWLSWTSMPDIEKQLVFAIAKNITEKKKIEEERNNFIANLTQVNQDIKQFTRMASHDIRSPISNMLSIFNLFDSTKITDPDTTELLRLLKNTSKNLNDIVNNFLDVMINNDRLNALVEQLSLTESLETVKNSISTLIADSGAVINSDFSAFDFVKFNRIYMDSIFLNLITNAIKYGGANRPSLINIHTKKDGAVNQLIISDNGSGFDSEKLKDSVFGLYQTFHGNSDSKGIGLHLVYTHVTSLGGHIAVQSKVDEGTTFTITFRSEK